MSEFNKQLSELYRSLATSQKNIKGDPHKGDSMANFRGKKGVSDVGIPLSPKAAKRKQSNRAGYHYPQHLQNINERRRRDAMRRHGITNIEDPFKQNFKASTQPAEQRNYSSTWRPPIDDGPKKKKTYIYYDEYSAPTAAEEVTYIWNEPRKKRSGYKATGKFPKLDEAIASYKKK